MDGLVKINVTTAYEVALRYSVSEAAAALLQPQQMPAEFLKILEQHALFEDAIQFLAHALPKRLAVWWVCLVAETVTERSETSPHYVALQATESWVRQPTEAHRRQAEAAAAKTNFSSPASWAATAAFWCTGSLAAADMPMVAPPSYLYAHAVYGGIGLAAVTPSPDQYQEKMLRYYRIGLTLARGGSGRTEQPSAQALVS